MGELGTTTAITDMWADRLYKLGAGCTKSGAKGAARYTPWRKQKIQQGCLRPVEKVKKMIPLFHLRLLAVDVV